MLWGQAARLKGVPHSKTLKLHSNRLSFPPPQIKVWVAVSIYSSGSDMLVSTAKVTHRNLRFLMTSAAVFHMKQSTYIIHTLRTPEGKPAGIMI